MKNSGKIFEDDFKSSIPDYCFYHRLKDPPQSFNQSKNNLRFSLKNPCDAMIFDTKNRKFYTLELKTTKNSSISFEDINIKEKQQNKMIHKHQIESLLKFSKYNHVISGFIFNFRNEKNNTQVTYFQNINNFINMINSINKKSFNQKDLSRFSSIIITGEKKRIRYKWDLDMCIFTNIK